MGISPGMRVQISLLNMHCFGGLRGNILGVWQILFGGRYMGRKGEERCLAGPRYNPQRDRGWSVFYLGRSLYDFH